MRKENDPRRSRLTPDRVLVLLNGSDVSTSEMHREKTHHPQEDFIATMIEGIPGVLAAVRVQAKEQRPVRCYKVVTEALDIQVKLAQNSKDREGEIADLLKDVPEGQRSIWLKENAIIVAFRPRDKEDARFQSVLEGRIQAIHNYHRRTGKK